MSDKIMITGAAGFLGYHLTFLLSDDYTVAGTFHEKMTSVVPVQLYKVDITDPESVESCVDIFKPDYLVHAAACADVDWCEKNPEEAMRVNRDGSAHVAEICVKHSIPLILISTDLVFDGKKGDYIEKDDPNPINLYGKSKLAGERRVLDISGDNIVFRVALLFGPDSPFKKGYIVGTMEKIRNGEKAYFFKDQYRTPLYTADVASAIDHVVQRKPSGGVYHLSGPDKLNRYEFGLKMQEAYGFKDEFLIPALMEDLPELMPRPKDVSLNHKKASSAFGFDPTDVEVALRSIIA
ncbi:MAG: sugar nucleotide-binding protein [candidate division Zixibacteria bacterium]|nr:sugar nucleotide-binding protein [candidate division Zixibacteria bacterium]